MRIAGKIIVPILLIIGFSTFALAFFSYKVRQEDELVLQKRAQARQISSIAVELDRLEAEVGFHLLAYRFRVDEEDRRGIKGHEAEIQDLIEEVLGLLRSGKERRLVEEFVLARRGIGKIQDDLIESIRSGEKDQVARTFKSWVLKHAIVQATLRDLVVYTDLDEARTLEEISSKRAARSFTILAVFALTAILAALAVVFYVKAVVAPLHQVTDVAERIASGDLGQRASAVERTDEIGALARAFNSMLAGLAQRERLEASEKKLKTAVAEAERANQAKSMFLAHMSHEIRTPMNAVVALSELLRKTNLDEVQAKLLDGICQGSETLMATINDILDVSKIQAGKIELEELPFDLHEMIDGALALIGSQAETKGLTLRCEISEGVPRRILGDSTRLRQIVLNLLSNAVKFTPRGEVRLAMEWTADRRELSLTVADTGIGIPEERIESLFAPFTQADVSTTREYGGTGLGLTLVKSLVDAMKGSLEVQSEVDRGTTFRLRLVVEEVPAVDAEEEGASKGRAGREGGRKTRLKERRLAEGRTPRILLVEDNLVNQLVANHLMRDLGFRFDLASDGEEAVRMTLEQSYDVILMDVHMPRLDGLEAARRIREHNEGEGPWIIAMTADVLESDRDKCLTAGMNDFVAKPIVRAALETALERALSR